LPKIKNPNEVVILFKTKDIMEKQYYTITEVSKLLDIKPYVIRYWETEFPQIRKSRKSGRNRRYSVKEVEIITDIKILLYDKKFTIKGAKQALSSEEGLPMESNFNEQTPAEQLKIVRGLLNKIKDIAKKHSF